MNRPLVSSALLLAATFACGAPPPMGHGSCTFSGTSFDAGFGGSGGGFVPAFTEPLFRVGRDEVVSLTVPKTVHCDDDVVASSVRVAVLGPDNLPVPFTAGEPASLDFGYQVDVHFTPQKGGPYHFVAIFEPNLGQAQLDRRAATYVTTHEVNALAAGNCTTWGLTARDTALCTDGTDVLRTTRSNGLEGTLPGQRMAVRENVVWVAFGAKISRYVDDGMALALAGEVDGTIAPVVLLAGADEVVVVGTTTAQRYALEAGVLVAHEQWSYGLITPSDHFGAARNGDDLLVANGSTLCTAHVRATATCSNDARDVTGYGPEGIWLQGVSNELVRREAGSTSAVSLPEPIGSNLDPTAAAFGGRPVMRASGDIVYTPSSEPYPSLVGWTLTSTQDPVMATAEWIAVRDGPGPVRFLRIVP